MRQTKYMVIIISVIISTCSNIIHYSTYTPYINNTQFISYSWVGSVDYFATILKEGTPRYVQIFSLANTTLDSPTENNYVVNFMETMQLRTIGNSFFLVFDKINLYKYQSNFTTSTNLFTVPNQKTQIQDSQFFQTDSDVLLLYKTQTSYQLRYSKNSLTLAETTLPINLRSIFKKSQVASTVIMLLFDIGLVVYQPTLTSINLKYLDTHRATQQTSLFISENLLFYSYDKKLFVKDVDFNYTTVYSFNFTDKIHDLAIARPPYLLVSTLDAIQQFDLEIGAVINKVNIKMEKKNIGVLINRYFVIYTSFPSESKYINIYEMNDFYNTQGSTCMQGYFFNKKLCYKNYSFTFTNSSSLISQNTTNIISLNQTQNETNATSLNQTNIKINGTDSNVSNITLNSSTLNSSLQTNTSLPLNQKQSYPEEKSVDEKSMATKLSRALGKVFIATSFKISPKSLASFLVFFDDFQYYNYHRYEYPTSIEFLLSNTDLINAQRLNANLFYFVSSINSKVVAENQDKKSFGRLPYHKNHPKSIYFLRSTQPIYKTSVITNFCLLFILRIALFVLGYVAKSCRKIQKVHSCFEASTRCWSLLVAIVETNLTKLSFSCALQVLVTGFDSPFDKFNTCIMVFGLLIALFYALIFYPLVYKYSDKKAASTILVRSFYAKRSFFLESFCVLVRNFVRGFCHAIFSLNYHWQITSLVVIDSLFVIITLIFQRNFLNKYVFILYVTYQIFLLSFDSLFLFVNRKTVTISPSNLDLISLVLVICIVSISVLLSLAIMIHTIKDFFADSPIFQQKNKNSKQINQIETETDKKNHQIQIPAELIIQVERLTTDPQLSPTYQLRNPKIFPPLIKKSSNTIKQENLLQASKLIVANKSSSKIKKSKGNGDFLHQIQIEQKQKQKDPKFCIGKRRPRNK